MINISHNLLHLLHNDNFLYNSLNFNNFFTMAFNLDYFLNLSLYFFELFDDHWYFNNLLYYLLNVVVDSDQLRNDFFDFDEFVRLFLN